jgi:hypothetical protein
MVPVSKGQERVVPAVILLTDDADNRRKAESEGLQAVSGKKISSFTSPSLSIIGKFVAMSMDAAIIARFWIFWQLLVKMIPNYQLQQEQKQSTLR